MGRGRDKEQRLGLGAGYTKAGTENIPDNTVTHQERAKRSTRKNRNPLTKPHAELEQGGGIILPCRDLGLGTESVKENDQGN